MNGSVQTSRYKCSLNSASKDTSMLKAADTDILCAHQTQETAFIASLLKTRTRSSRYHDKCLIWSVRHPLPTSELNNCQAQTLSTVILVGTPSGRLAEDGDLASQPYSGVETDSFKRKTISHNTLLAGDRR